MPKIDLHIHSNVSDDGELLPEQIMQKCRNAGMELVAVTDHNSVRGVSAALQAAEGVQVLSGIELDCIFKGKNYHLLGYGIDYTDIKYTLIEQDIIMQEQKAAKEKLRLFSEATGIPVCVKDIMEHAVNGVVTGEQIAEYVLAQENAAEYQVLRPYLPEGKKSDMPYVRFYWDFFSEGKSAYVPIHYIRLTDAVNLIHDTGGIAVLAHPGQNKTQKKDVQEMITEGIDGLEVFSSYHDGEDRKHYLEIAENNNLLVTCGSDFHGRNKPQISIGGHGATWPDERLLSDIRFKIKEKSAGRAKA